MQHNRNADKKQNYERVTQRKEVTAKKQQIIIRQSLNDKYKIKYFVADQEKVANQEQVLN